MRQGVLFCCFSSPLRFSLIFAHQAWCCFLSQFQFLCRPPPLLFRLYFSGHLLWSGWEVIGSPCAVTVWEPRSERVNECRYLCPAPQTNNLIHPELTCRNSSVRRLIPRQPGPACSVQDWDEQRGWWRGKWAVFACKWNVFLRFVPAFLFVGNDLCAGARGREACPLVGSALNWTLSSTQPHDPAFMVDTVGLPMGSIWAHHPPPRSSSSSSVCSPIKMLNYSLALQARNDGISYIFMQQWL